MWVAYLDFFSDVQYFHWLNLYTSCLRHVQIVWGIDCRHVTVKLSEITKYFCTSCFLWDLWTIKMIIFLNFRKPYPVNVGILDNIKLVQKNSKNSIINPMRMYDKEAIRNYERFYYWIKCRGRSRVFSAKISFCISGKMKPFRKLFSYLNCSLDQILRF